MQEERFTEYTISISRLNKWVQKMKCEAMRAYDLKGAHVLCLYQIARKPQGASFAEVAGDCDFDRAFCSRVLRELTERQLVEKRGEEGKYRACYRLTKEGKALIPKLRSIINRVQALLDEGISKEELEVYYRVVNQMLKNMEAISENADEVLTAD